MMIFWISTVAMILVALGILAPALLRKSRADSLDREEQNVAIAREHLVELEAGLAEGVLDQQQFEQAKLELEQSLLFDIETRDDAAEEQNSKGSGRMVLALLAVAIPVLAISLYYHLGTPQLLEPQIAGHASAGWVFMVWMGQQDTVIPGDRGIRKKHRGGIKAVDPAAGPHRRGPTDLGRAQC